MSHCLGGLVCPLPRRAFSPAWGAGGRSSHGRRGGKVSGLLSPASFLPMREPDVSPAGQESPVNPYLALFPTWLCSTPGSGSLFHSSPFRNQNKTPSLSYSWLTHIKNALVLDYYACHDLKKKNHLASQWKSLSLCFCPPPSPPLAATDAPHPACGELRGSRGNFQKGKPLFKISVCYPIT